MERCGNVALALSIMLRASRYVTCAGKYLNIYILFIFCFLTIFKNYFSANQETLSDKILPLQLLCAKKRYSYIYLKRLQIKRNPQSRSPTPPATGIKCDRCTLVNQPNARWHNSKLFSMIELQECKYGRSIPQLQCQICSRDEMLPTSS